MRCNARRLTMLVIVSVTALVAASVGTAAAGDQDGSGPRHHDAYGPHFANTLFVSKRGSDSTTCGRAWSPCLTIGQAVANAPDGGRITVQPGTYTEMVTVHQRVSLQGVHATIDATGQDNGILLQGAAASGSNVSGFSVENALGEGILASMVDHVTISWNQVHHNDQGITAPNAYPECQAQGEIPGDCGEGLHLQATTNSAVYGNDVSENAGGILVSDDIAATHGNLIAYNRVTDNAPDCGITVPAHNPAAGVYDNTIAANWVTGNGEGGVLIAAGVPGSAAHDNRVIRNYLADNGFAGVTLHAHAPGQNLDGNVIEGNRIRTNNVGGDGDAGVTQTTGILIFSGDPSVSINNTSIRHNFISDNHFGIWLSPGLVSSDGIANNTFVHVDVPVQQ
jgi:nitrous oxidase accessory protein NosD